MTAAAQLSMYTEMFDFIMPMSSWKSPSGYVLRQTASLYSFAHYTVQIHNRGTTMNSRIVVASLRNLQFLFLSYSCFKWRVYLHYLVACFLPFCNLTSVLHMVKTDLLFCLFQFMKIQVLFYGPNEKFHQSNPLQRRFHV